MSTPRLTFPQSEKSTRAQVWFLSADQQRFTLTEKASRESVRVELNGAIHTEPGFFFVTSRTEVVLTQPALAGDTVRISYTLLRR